MKKHLWNTPTPDEDINKKKKTFFPTVIYEKNPQNIYPIQKNEDKKHPPSPNLFTKSVNSQW